MTLIILINMIIIFISIIIIIISSSSSSSMMMIDHGWAPRRTAPRGAAAPARGPPALADARDYYYNYAIICHSILYYIMTLAL